MFRSTDFLLLFKTSAIFQFNDFQFKHHNVLPRNGMGNICKYRSSNSLRPSDAYIRQYTSRSLVQIVACLLSGTKPWSEPILQYSLHDPWKQLLVIFGSKYNNSQMQYVFENVVCKVTAIVSQPLCVNSSLDVLIPSDTCWSPDAPEPAYSNGLGHI